MSSAEPAPSVAGRITPQLPQPRIPAAPLTVEPVADRVLLVVVLVVLLSWPELRRPDDLGNDRPPKRLVLFQSPLRRLGQPALLLAVVEDGGAVLVTAIRSLPVRLSTIEAVVLFVVLIHASIEKFAAKLSDGALAISTKSVKSGSENARFTAPAV